MLKSQAEKPVVVAPDVGSAKRARTFALELGCEMAVIDKRRCSAKEIERGALIGDVEGHTAVLVDDICSTGETLKCAAKACHEAGAKSVFAAVTHGVNCDFDTSAIDKLFVTDTIAGCRAEVVPVAQLFAEAIDAIISARSISSLYRRL